jgi:integrase
VKAAAKRAGDEAAKLALESGADPEAARGSATKPFPGFRFHDLRHQSITEMAEAGVPEAAMQSIAGHLSKRMLDHYSHVRMAAKRSAVEAFGGGLIVPDAVVRAAKGKANQ